MKWFALLREDEVVAVQRFWERPTTMDFNFPLMAGFKYSIKEAEIDLLSSPYGEGESWDTGDNQ